MAKKGVVLELAVWKDDFHAVDKLVRVGSMPIAR